MRARDVEGDREAEPGAAFVLVAANPPGGGQMEAVFGDLPLAETIYADIALIAAGIAIVTRFVSRGIVARH
ncbi:MAG: hypothetical protein ACREDD_03100 [Methylocella sp.]